MSFNLCSISRMIALEPVVSIKSGHIFEKKLIYKYIETTGRCPLTKYELTKNDLIEIKIENSEKNSTPRNTLNTSMPGMLTNLQDEWENLILETFDLKKELVVARQELAHSLYQKDAVTNVICNLLKEIEIAREELLNYQTEFGENLQLEEMVYSADEYNFMGISKDIINKITEKSYQLITMRKSKKTPENLINFVEIGNFKCKNVWVPFEENKNSRITCQDLKNNFIIIANDVGNIAISEISDKFNFLKKSKKVIKAHKKKINDVEFYPNSGILGFATCSDDFTAAFYLKSQINENFEERYRTGNSVHNDVISGLCFHPLNEYAIFSSLDGYWSFHNLMKGIVIHRENSGHELTTVRFHPDGGLFATAQKNGVVRLWDILSQEEFNKLQENGMNSTSHISFSENGYYVATCGEEDKTVRVWDIRKLNVVKRIELENDMYASNVEFDESGNYLGIVGHGIEIFNMKTGEIHHKNTFENHKNVITSINFENNLNKYFVTASIDGDVKLHA